MYKKYIQYNKQSGGSVIKKRVNLKGDIAFEKKSRKE